MFGNAIPALVVTAGLLQGFPPIYGPSRGLPPRVLQMPIPVPLPVDGCLSRGEARDAVQSGQVVPFSSVLGQIRSSVDGDIVSTPLLCNQGGRLIYFLDVLVGGRVIRLQVDGQTGRVGP